MAAKGDENSKIRNILKDSKFEEYRIDSFIENLPAKRLFNMLEKVDEKEIKSLRDNFINEYVNNMQRMFNAIAKKQ